MLWNVFFQKKRRKILATLPKGYYPSYSQDQKHNSQYQSNSLIKMFKGWCKNEQDKHDQIEYHHEYSPDKIKIQPIFQVHSLNL